jgi:hypothetical protein
VVEAAVLALLALLVQLLVALVDFLLLLLTVLELRVLQELSQQPQLLMLKTVGPVEQEAQPLLLTHRLEAHQLGAALVEDRVEVTQQPRQL